MKAKSLAVNLLTVLVASIAAFSGLFSESAQAWLGIVAFGITIVLQSPFFSSGQMPAGWTPVLIITNVAAILIQLLTAIGDKHLLDPTLCNYIIIGMNILLTGFIKDYGNGSILGKTKLS